MNEEISLSAYRRLIKEREREVKNAIERLVVANVMYTEAKERRSKKKARR